MLTEDGRFAEKIVVRGREFVLAEPSCWDLERFDDVMANIADKKERPNRALPAMRELVHACVVTPTMTFEEFSKWFVARSVRSAIPVVMRLAGAEGDGKGEAGSA